MTINFADESVNGNFKKVFYHLPLMKYKEPEKFRQLKKIINPDLIKDLIIQLSKNQTIYL